ncbi:zinc-dependent metalloprotease [Kamptonema formosum]|uniref:zinc-dependent metalloprotease n=1 Tax=Kamptonema formosum TaxID=331992 RepID=UPI00034D471A|nr:zinc-dependent metalloprotease [Oscillatoria sp. PCC 10802]
MKILAFCAIILHGTVSGIGPLSAQEPPARSPVPAALAQQPEHPPSESSAGDESNSDMTPFDTAVKDAEKLQGLFTLYRQKETGKIYLEIKPEQLNKNYLAAITMESGIGEGILYRGFPLGEFLFYFRRVNKNLHFVVRNVNFRTQPDDPQARSLQSSFSDSVLYSLKIKSIHPQRKTLLIDFSELLLSDVPGLTQILPWMLGAPYQLDKDKSYIGAAKAFPLNVELESVYGFSGGGDTPAYIPSLPDSRAFSISVRYSLSQLPENNGYRPRKADERVGYFLTAYKDFSNDSRKDPFVRYINRWHLEKQDPSAPLSPPKQPIVFWIENTVPVEYRQTIKEGVLMWNKAFETAGFLNAIEVRQMPDSASWDPADVRYNTIRWSNSFESWFAAIGPSRVNPLTGEILDADIIVDGSVVRSVKQGFRTFVEPRSATEKSLLWRIAENYCHSYDLPSRAQTPRSATVENTGSPGQTSSQTFVPAPQQLPVQVRSLLSRLMGAYDLCHGFQSTQHFAMGALNLSLLRNAAPDSPEMKEYVRQYLRELIAHEVGHTLGLRHNFHGSTMLMPEELENTEITRTRGLVGSVMDYNGVNLAPPGVGQGDYYTTLVGPYDHWAIEYGYAPVPAGNPLAESQFLQGIAQQAPHPELAYSTDEDSADIDPGANTFDLSGDVLRHSQLQMDLAREIWSRLEQRQPATDETYSDIRQMFDTVLGYYFNQAMLLTNYIGGQSFHRDRPSDPNGRLPFEPVPVDKQRQALAALQKYIFSQDAFRFSPQLLNKLASERWSDWGNAPALSLDYPIHDRLYFVQGVLLRVLLDGYRLTRLRDIELKSPPGQALTLPELFDSLESGIWTEVLPGDSDSLSISSVRRSLQRDHLGILMKMVLRTSDVPEDARTLAWQELRQLHKSIDKKLRRQGRNLDAYTRAHLEETRDRIAKTLDAGLRSN